MNVIDLHVDTLSRLLHEGGEFSGPRPEFHIDVPRAREGGLRAMCAACFTPDDDPSPTASVGRMLDLAEALDRDPETPVRLVRSPDDLSALPEGTLGMIPTIENGRSLGEDLDLLDEWRTRGVALLGVTWNGANALGQGVGADTGEGLTALGRAALLRAASLGMAIDISHLNPAGVEDVCALGVPVLATHSNCRALHDHRRNLDDAQLGALASAGGIVGINLYPPFLGEDPVGVERFVAHVRHAAERIGVERVALGTDLDGIDRTADGFRDVRDLPVLAHALRDDGFSAEEVEGILGGHFLRWWRSLV